MNIIIFKLIHNQRLLLNMLEYMALNNRGWIVYKRFLQTLKV